MLKTREVIAALSVLLVFSPPLFGNSFEWVSLYNNMKWETGQIEWFYNPTYKDPKITSEQAINVIQLAMSNWEAVCNVKFTYKGLTDTEVGNLDDKVNAIGFAPASVIDAGSAATAFSVPISKNGKTYVATADIAILSNFSNYTYGNTYLSFQGVVTHELGHLLGLAHSNVSTSIMYVAPSHEYTYDATPRQDDINGCVSKYGKPSVQKSFVYTDLDSMPVTTAPSTDKTPTTTTPTPAPTPSGLDNVNAFDNASSISGDEPIHLSIFVRPAISVPDGTKSFVVASYNGNLYFLVETNAWVLYKSGVDANSLAYETAKNGQLYNSALIDYPKNVLSNVQVYYGYGSSFDDMIHKGNYKKVYWI